MGAGAPADFVRMTLIPTIDPAGTGSDSVLRPRTPARDPRIASYARRMLPGAAAAAASATREANHRVVECPATTPESN